jgi:hypothetical protein
MVELGADKWGESLYLRYLLLAEGRVLTGYGPLHEVSGNKGEFDGFE